MRWTAPPERREVFLVVLSLSIYFLARRSLLSGDFDVDATRGILLRKVGLGSTSVIGKDGLKPAGWRDELEKEIYGTWRWDEGHVAGNGGERAQKAGADRHGAAWAGKVEADQSISSTPLATVDQGVWRWGEDIPQTTLLQHKPGYTILDNLFVFDGSVYIVSDSANSLPPLSDIIANLGSGFGPWKVISTDQALKLIGSFGTLVRGVSWLSADAHPHNSTLFALWRAYSSLDTGIDSTGRTTLRPPRRLIFPHNRYFLDADPPPNVWHPEERRMRFDIGIHPFTAKAAFPKLAIQAFGDWQDINQLRVPFVYERIVIADRRAARRQLTDEDPMFSPAFALKGSKHWFEPIRRNLETSLGLYGAKQPKKPVVTYLHAQNDLRSPQLSDTDHESLISALKKSAYWNGFELQVVSTDTAQTSWFDRMSAISRSTVVLGVHGYHLIDSVFMKPSFHSALIEVFPPGMFKKDQQFIVTSMGHRYMAWSGPHLFDKVFPPMTPPNSEAIQIDPHAIADTIKSLLAQAPH